MDRHPLMANIFDIYSNDYPDFITPFLQAKSIQRLEKIDQGCGTNYCGFYNHDFLHNRFDHSVGVALIVWHFTKDIKQTLSGLFHDISHTVFSHVGDFLLGDAETQESSEQHLTKLIQEDETIMNELNKLGIKLEEVDDYTKYPIADNNGPQLSADRLEYTISGGVHSKRRVIDDVKKIYDDIIVGKNEHGIVEIGFKTKEMAFALGMLSLQNDQEAYSSYEPVATQSYLAKIFEYMIKEGHITHEDLYIKNDEEVIAMMKTTTDSNLREMRAFYENLSSYRVYRSKPNIDNFCVSSKCKKRFIDPLVFLDTGTKRLSELSSEFVEMRDYHLNRKEERIELDYKFKN